jgi:hypothetical protein
MKEKAMENNNEYKGYSLFNDIEDNVLRTRNRAVTLANMAESHMTPKKQITPKGAATMLKYMELIPAEERTPVTERFIQAMQERNYVLA